MALVTKILSILAMVGYQSHEMLEKTDNNEKRAFAMYQFVIPRFRFHM